MFRTLAVVVMHFRPLQSLALRTGLALCASLVLSACLYEQASLGHQAEGSIGTEGQAIIGGSDSTTSQDAVVHVVTVVGSDTALSCSGALLAPNLVLTARHCIAPAPSEGSFVCHEDGSGEGDSVRAAYPASSIYILTGASAELNLDHAKAQVTKILHDQSDHLCNHDMALLVLDTPINDVPIASIRLDAPTKVNETFTALGYGVTTTGYPIKRQQRPGVSVEWVGPLQWAQLGVVLGPNEFSSGESTCLGDSGGPALATGTQAVIGVATRGGNDHTPDPMRPWVVCTDNGNGFETVYTETVPFKSLILQAYAEAGQKPWLEGQSNPQATPGSMGTSNAISNNDGTSANAPATHASAVSRSSCASVSRGGPEPPSRVLYAAYAALALCFVQRRKRA